MRRAFMTMDKATLVTFVEQVTDADVDKFTAVVSNPPYQISTGGNTGAGYSVWDEFVMVSSYISKTASFVNPGRWMRGGQGTGMADIRHYFFNGGNLKQFIIFKDSEVFDGIRIGDVTIELLDYTSLYNSIKRGQSTEKGDVVCDMFNPLNSTLDIMINSSDEALVQKILDAHIGPSFESELWIGGQDNNVKRKAVYATGRNDYGVLAPRIYREPDYFITDDQRQKQVNYLTVYFSPKAKQIDCRYLPMSELQDTKKNNERVVAWKACIPRTGAQSLYRNSSFTAPPNSLTTNTWLCRCFNTLQEVDGYLSYVETYFYRYLINTRRTSHDALASIHRWVPDLVNIVNPRTGKKGYESDWIDDDLRTLLQDVLTDDDWRYIKAEAIAADNGKGDYENGFELPEPYGWSALHSGETWGGKHASLSV